MTLHLKIPLTPSETDVPPAPQAIARLVVQYDTPTAPQALAPFWPWC